MREDRPIFQDNGLVLLPTDITLPKGLYHRLEGRAAAWRSTAVQAASRILRDSLGDMSLRQGERASRSAATGDGWTWDSGDLPATLYGCHRPGCAENCTYPPEMLHWHDGWQLEKMDGEDFLLDLEAGMYWRDSLRSQLEAGFYCEWCLDEEASGWRYRRPPRATLEDALELQQETQPGGRRRDQS